MTFNTIFFFMYYTDFYGIISLLLQRDTLIDFLLYLTFLLMGQLFYFILL